MKPSYSLFNSILISTAFLSLLVAPQYRLPTATPIALSLTALCALALAKLYEGFLYETMNRVIPATTGIETKSSVLVLGLAHLPLALIWFFPVDFPGQLGQRPHLWICGAVATMLMSLLLVLFLRCGQAGQRRAAMVFASTTNGRLTADRLVEPRPLICYWPLARVRKVSQLGLRLVASSAP